MRRSLLYVGVKVEEEEDKEREKERERAKMPRTLIKKTLERENFVACLCTLGWKPGLAFVLGFILWEYPNCSAADHCTFCGAHL